MFDLTINYPDLTTIDECDGFAGLVGLIERDFRNSVDDRIIVVIARSDTGRLKALLRIRRNRLVIDYLDSVDGFENELRALGFTVTRH